MPTKQKITSPQKVLSPIQTFGNTNNKQAENYSLQKNVSRNQKKIESKLDGKENPTTSKEVPFSKSDTVTATTKVIEEKTSTVIRTAKKKQKKTASPTTAANSTATANSTTVAWKRKINPDGKEKVLPIALCTVEHEIRLPTESAGSTNSAEAGTIPTTTTDKTGSSTSGKLLDTENDVKNFYAKVENEICMLKHWHSAELSENSEHQKLQEALDMLLARKSGEVKAKKKNDDQAKEQQGRTEEAKAKEQQGRTDEAKAKEQQERTDEDKVKEQQGRTDEAKAKEAMAVASDAEAETDNDKRKPSCMQKSANEELLNSKLLIGSPKLSSLLNEEELVNALREASISLTSDQQDAETLAEAASPIPTVENKDNSSDDDYDFVFL